MRDKFVQQLLHRVLGLVAHDRIDQAVAQIKQATVLHIDGGLSALVTFAPRHLNQPRFVIVTVD